MIDKILAFIGPVLTFINNIFGLFKKSSAEKETGVLSDNQDEKDRVKRTGRA